MFTCGVCLTGGQRKTAEENAKLLVKCDKDWCQLSWYHYDYLSSDDPITIDMTLLFSEVMWMCPVCVKEI